VRVNRVIVVGGGIVGAMHALLAHSSGAHVVHLEREAAARGASVRNFGLIWVSGRAAGDELALALRARLLWEQVAASIDGIGFRANGSLTLARDDVEMKVLAEAAALPDASRRGFELLDPQGVRTANPGVAGDIAGGLLCRRDALVEPRRAAAAIREWLSKQPRYDWLPGREVVTVADHAVHDQTGESHEGDRVFVCTGAWHTGVAAAALAGSPIRRVRLQMMQTAPMDARLTTSIADADSLRYYPAFAALPLAQLPAQPPVAQERHMQLLLAQRLDGSLTIGDTHEYDVPFGFDVNEAPYEHLRDRAAQLLGRRLPPTERRWAGVYSQVTDDRLYHRSHLADGVTLVTGAGGRGMTCAPAIAEESLA
jgi:FAD dependent oxidoreductase TIGR03364